VLSSSFAVGKPLTCTPAGGYWPVASVGSDPNPDCIRRHSRPIGSNACQWRCFHLEPTQAQVTGMVISRLRQRTLLPSLFRGPIWAWVGHESLHDHYPCRVFAAALAPASAVGTVQHIFLRCKGRGTSSLDGCLRGRDASRAVTREGKWAGRVHLARPAWVLHGRERWNATDPHSRPIDRRTLTVTIRWPVSPRREPHAEKHGGRGASIVDAAGNAQSAMSAQPSGTRQGMSGTRFSNPIAERSSSCLRAPGSGPGYIRGAARCDEQQWRGTTAPPFTANSNCGGATSRQLRLSVSPRPANVRL